MHIVMVAAENGTLPGAKVGGIGDVIRDVPRALAQRGHQVTVLTPGYQALSRLPSARLLHTLTVGFGGALEPLSLFCIETPDEPPEVRHLVIENPLFAACGAGKIYCHDINEPFATDAAKFALFCQAVCHVLVTGAVPQADILHLHDWHAALVLLLRNVHPGYQPLRAIPAVYTIHNLSLQGVRPFAGNWSSPEHWFPALQFPHTRLADPEAPHCINLMRTGINLADRVHVVSPTYAREILEPSNVAEGLIRGEGLEADLQAVAAAGRLHGILNGCDYRESSKSGRKPAKQAFIDAATLTLGQWVGGRPLVEAAHFHAQQRLLQWAQRKTADQCVVGSVGRLTPQKVSLLQEATGQGRYALDDLLDLLDKGMLVMLGSGDAACEEFMVAAMRRHENFVFLCGYSEELGDLLYRFCDLFLMPSSFEPCGISQMLAMRAGTPCLVHSVGGLADTVQHMVNGFAFSGANRAEQVRNLLGVFADTLQLQSMKLPVWQGICRNAAAARFPWEETVREYEAVLYQLR